MTEKPPRGSKQEGGVFHLPKRRTVKSFREEVAQEVELSIAAHFREQTQFLKEMNISLSEKVQRLTVGIERLVTEMHGVRTGQKEEAFARIAPLGAPADLPTVSAEAALFYTHTSEDIGRELGFHPSQIGLLLSTRGLGWAGNSDYQETSRHKKKSQTKFWHREVPERLRKILDEGKPEYIGIKDKSVLAIFRKWSERHANCSLLEALDLSEAPH